MGARVVPDIVQRSDELEVSFHAARLEGRAHTRACSSQRSPHRRAPDRSRDASGWGRRSPTTRYMPTGLAAGQKIAIRVAAMRKTGLSTWSDAPNVTVRSGGSTQRSTTKPRPSSRWPGLSCSMRPERCERSRQPPPPLLQKSANATDCDFAVSMVPAQFVGSTYRR